MLLLNETAIAIIEQRLTEVEQVLPLMEAAVERGFKALVIVASDVSGAALRVSYQSTSAGRKEKAFDLGREAQTCGR